MAKVLQTLAKMQERQYKVESRKDKSDKEVAMLRKDFEEIKKDVGMVRQLRKDTDKQMETLIESNLVEVVEQVKKDLDELEAEPGSIRTMAKQTDVKLQTVIETKLVQSVENRVIGHVDV